MTEMIRFRTENDFSVMETHGFKDSDINGEAAGDLSGESIAINDAGCSDYWCI